MSLFRIMRDDDQGGQGGGGGSAAGSGAAGAGAQGSQGGSGAGQGGAAAAQGGDRGGQGTQGQQPQQGQFSIPKEYEGKGWAKKVKSIDDVFKQLDNLDSVAGKKHVIPDLSKRDDPDVKQYLENFRGSTKVTDYKFAEGTPKEFSEKVGTMLFNKNIPASIGNEIIAEYQNMVKADLDAMFSADGMKAELKNVFGDDADGRSKDVINMVADILGPEGKEFVETKIPNHFIGFMYKFMDSVRAKYGINDSGNGGNGGEGGSGGGDINSVRAEIRAQIRALDSRTHTAEEKAALQAKLDATYKK